MNSFYLPFIGISSFYEFVATSLAIVIPAIVLAGIIYRKNRSRSTFSLFIVSYLLLGLLFGAFCLLINELSSIRAGNLLQISLIIASFINLINIATFYNQRGHFESTLNTSIILVIVSCTFTPFLPAYLIVAILAATVSAFINIWFNNYLGQLILRRQQK